MDRRPISRWHNAAGADVAYPISIPDRRYSYQTPSHLEIPLEHCEPLTVPGDFDHICSKLGWTPHFNDGFHRKQGHHPGFFSSVRLKQPDGGKRRVDAIPLHGVELC